MEVVHNSRHIVYIAAKINEKPTMFLPSDVILCATMATTGLADSQYTYCSTAVPLDLYRYWSDWLYQYTYTTMSGVSFTVEAARARRDRE